MRLIDMKMENRKGRIVVLRSRPLAPLLFAEILVLFALALLPSALPGAEEKAEGTIDSNPEQHSIVFRMDNDVITDQYYTSGLRLAYLQSESTLTGDRGLLFPLDGGTTRGLGIEQEIYTPHDTDSRGVSYGDRPYAAWSYINLFRDHSFSCYDELCRMKTDLSLGVVGQAAGGEPTQVLLHKNLWTSDVPGGWENQIPSSTGWNASVELSHPVIVGSIDDSTTGWEHRLHATGGGRIGNVRTGLFGGFQYRGGVFQRDGVSRYIYASITGRALAYDHTLEGALQSDHTYTVTQNRSLELALFHTFLNQHEYTSIGDSYTAYHMLFEDPPFYNPDFQYHVFDRLIPHKQDNAGLNYIIYMALFENGRVMNDTQKMHAIWNMHREPVVNIQKHLFLIYHVVFRDPTDELHPLARLNAFMLLVNESRSLEERALQWAIFNTVFQKGKPLDKSVYTVNARDFTGEIQAGFGLQHAGSHFQLGVNVSQIPFRPQFRDTPRYHTYFTFSAGFPLGSGSF